MVDQILTRWILENRPIKLKISMESYKERGTHIDKFFYKILAMPKVNNVTRKFELNLSNLEDKELIKTYLEQLQ